jgi:hypothetical protein
VKFVGQCYGSNKKTIDAASTRMILDKAQPAQPVVSSTDDETHEPSPYRPTFIDNDEPQIQPTNNAVAYNGVSGTIY